MDEAMKLEDLEKICDEATPGPWESYGSQIRRPVDDGFNFVGRINFHHDAKFVSSSRELMRRLLIVAKAAKELISRCQCCNPDELLKALEELESQ